LTEKTVSVWDVRKELYWLLTFLTSKEDEVVLDLMNDQVLLILSRHFSQVTKVTLESRNRGSIFQSAIPLIRIFGNLATAADGRYVAGIVAADNHAIIHALVNWLEANKPCGETMTIATEVTWVAGALLCDVGFPNHPSTVVACPLLLPPLCRVLLKGTFTLEWKREVLNAMWNALASPPGSNGDDTIIERDKLLLDIFREKGMIRSLVGMLVCLDVDAIRPALNMIDAMHRRMGRHDDNALQILAEAECLHALESVCDAASANASYGGAADWKPSTGGMDYCAEMAANLIDDFYGEEDVELDMGETKGSFEFGIQEPVPVFDFNSGSSNARDTTSNAVIADPMTLSAGRGRGRGRGRNMPAWMQQKR